MLRRVIVENGLVEGLPAADPRITSSRRCQNACAPLSTNSMISLSILSGDLNGKDADGSDMLLWKPFTEEDPNRMCFYDQIYLSSKGPDDLMKFLIR